MLLCRPRDVLTIAKGKLVLKQRTRQNTAPQLSLVSDTPAISIPTQFPKLRNDIGNLKVSLNGCWTWVGMTPPYGGKVPRNYVYELLMDEIPSGSSITQKCSTDNCVCPFHMKVQGKVKDATEFAHWLKVEAPFLKGAGEPRQPTPEKTGPSRPLPRMLPRSQPKGDSKVQTARSIGQFPVRVAPTPPPEPVKEPPLVLTHPMILPYDPTPTPWPSPPPEVKVEVQKKPIPVAKKPSVKKPVAKKSVVRPAAKAVVPASDTIFCPRGHAQIGENIYVYPNGIRKECGVCRKLRASNRKQGLTGGGLQKPRSA